VQRWRPENPGKPYKGSNVNRTVANTMLEQLAGSAPGAAAAGFTNAMSLGGVSAMAPEQYQAISQASPGLTMGGEVAGTIGGTQIVGTLGRELAKGVSQKLLGGGGGAQFGRNLAADAAYGAGYGGVTEGDPLGGAAAATIGSTLGQGLGTGLSKGLRGLTRTPEAEYLASRGIDNLTVGQNLGGKAKAFEDRAMSGPFYGDMVRDRRLDTFDQFNLAALNEAGAPVGATVNDTGERGLQQLLGDQGAIGRAYNQATAGVNVPLDPTFVADIAKARQVGASLPPDLAKKFKLALEDRVHPAVDEGQLTGDNFQQAMRGLKGFKSEHPKPGFEEKYRFALSEAQAALREQMERGGGQQVVEGLGKADEAYRLAQTIKAAQSAAKGGSGSGEIRVFTPSQLLNASERTAAKYPGPRPFAELADAGQKVLPSTIPDSGTAGRLAQFALPGVAATGAGVGGYAGGPEGAVTGAAVPLTLMALLAAGATKRGQKGLNTALFERSGAAKSTAEFLRRIQKAGLFGSPFVPLALEAQK